MLRNFSIGVAIGVLCFAAACSPSKRKLSIGAGSTTEQNVLTELLAQHIAAKMGVEVFVRTGLGVTATTHQALMVNEVDMYVDTLGALSAVVLKEKADSDAAMSMERVAKELERTSRIQILNQLGVNDPYVLIVRTKDAAERKIKTISEAAASKPAWDLAMTSDFQSRRDGNLAMQSAYSLPLKSVPVPRAPDEMYHLLEGGSIGMIAGSMIDGRLVNPEFTVLEDDKHAFQPAQLCVVVRLDTNQAFPELKGTIGQLNGKLSVELLRKLNAQVDVKHRPVKDVVADFTAGRIQ